MTLPKMSLELAGLKIGDKIYDKYDPEYYHIEITGDEVKETVNGMAVSHFTVPAMHHCTYKNPANNKSYPCRFQIATHVGLSDKYGFWNDVNSAYYKKPA